MVEQGCEGLYIDKHYIANNDRHWKPGETSSFTAYIDNDQSSSCDVTVFWEFHGADGTDTVESETKNGISGNTRFIQTKDYDYILSAVGPGIYNMKTALFHDGQTQVEEWYTDSNGEIIDIIVYDENGDMPPGYSNIVVEEISFDKNEYVVGEEGSATVTMLNTGKWEGTKTVQVEVSADGSGYEVAEEVDMTLGPDERQDITVNFTVGDTYDVNISVDGEVKVANVISDPIENQSLSVSSEVNRILAEYSFDNIAAIDIGFDVNVSVTKPSGAGDETVHDNKYSLTASADGRSTKTFDIGVSVPADQAQEYNVCVDKL